MADFETHSLPPVAASAISVFGLAPVRDAAMLRRGAALRFRFLIAGVDLARRGARRSGPRGRAERGQALIVGKVAFDLFAIVDGPGLRDRSQRPSQKQKCDEALHGHPGLRRWREHDVYFPSRNL